MKKSLTVKYNTCESVVITFSAPSIIFVWIQSSHRWVISNEHHMPSLVEPTIFGKSCFVRLLYLMDIWLLSYLCVPVLQQVKIVIVLLVLKGFSWSAKLLDLLFIKWMLCHTFRTFQVPSWISDTYGTYEHIDLISIFFTINLAFELLFVRVFVQVENLSSKLMLDYDREKF